MSYEQALDLLRRVVARLRALEQCGQGAIERLRHSLRQSPAAIDLPGKPMQALVDRKGLPRTVELGGSQGLLDGAGISQHLPTALHQPGVRLKDAAFFADGQFALWRRTHGLGQS